MCAKLLQSCPTLCNPMDCSLPGSSVHGDSPGKNTGVGCHFLFQFKGERGIIHLQPPVTMGRSKASVTRPSDFPKEA